MFPLKTVIASGTEDAQDAGRRRRGNSVAPVDVHEARRRLVTAATRRSPAAVSVRASPARHRPRRAGRRTARGGTSVRESPASGSGGGVERSGPKGRGARRRVVAAPAAESTPILLDCRRVEDIPYSARRKHVLPSFRGPRSGAGFRVLEGLWVTSTSPTLMNSGIRERTTPASHRAAVPRGKPPLSNNFRRPTGLPDWWEGWGRSGPLRRLIQKMNRSAVISSIGSIVQATGAESGRQQQPAPPHKPPHTVRWSVALVASAHAIAWADRHERGRHAQVAEVAPTMRSSA